MEPLRLLFFLLVAGVSFGFSQNCQTAPAVPAGQLKLAAGRVILDEDGVASIQGGQEVYARITNQSEINVPYWIVVELLPEGKKVYSMICKYQGELAPKTSAVILGSSSGEPPVSPVSFRVSVTKGPDNSDPADGILLYQVYSNPPKKNPPTPKP